MAPQQRNTFHLFLLASAMIGVVHVKDVCKTDTNEHGKSETNCSQQSLSDVPVSSIPTGTDVLLLNFNNLRLVSTSSFAGLPGLSKLDLSNNKLTKLDTSDPLPLEELNLSNNSLAQAPSLVGFKKLTKVVLAHNSITDVPDDVFRGLDKLKEIDLQGNQIAFLSDQVFEDLHVLESLDLSFNQLRILPRHLVSSLQMLNRFYLSGNRLTELPDQFFEGLDALAYVYLYNNPWNCNCALENLKTWVAENDFNIYVLNGTITHLDPESVRCSSPRKLKGTPVMQFPTDHCGKAVDGALVHEEEPTTSLPTTTEVTTQLTTWLPTTTERVTVPTTVLTEPITTFITTTMLLTTTDQVTELITSITTTEKLTKLTTVLETTTEQPTEPSTAIPTTTKTTPTTEPPTTTEKLTQKTTAFSTSIKILIPTSTHRPVKATTTAITTNQRKTQPTTQQYTSFTQTASPYEETTANVSTMEPTGLTTAFLNTIDVFSVIGSHDKQLGTLADYIAKYCCFLHLILYLVSLLILLLEILVLLIWMCWVYVKYYKPTKVYVQKPPNIWLVRYSLLNKEGSPQRAPARATGTSRPTFSSFRGAAGARQDKKRLSGPSPEMEVQPLATSVREYSLSTL
ncbi:platelet glycoprotein Ib alpha chain [Lissotriton helveticus]